LPGDLLGYPQRVVLPDLVGACGQDICYNEEDQKYFPVGPEPEMSLALQTDCVFEFDIRVN
jgi:hypothetical protein